MMTDTLTVVELVVLLTAYCAIFCPILAWVVSGKSPLKYLPLQPETAATAARSQ